MLKVLTTSALTVLLATSVVACGDSDSKSSTTGGDTNGTMKVADPWVQSGPDTASPAAAVYMTITSDSSEADALVDASASGSVAKEIELQQGTTSVSQVPIPADGKAVLEPDGYSIALVGLAQPLVDGTTVEIALQFEHAGNQTVEAEVRSEAP